MAMKQFIARYFTLSPAQETLYYYRALVVAASPPICIISQAKHPMSRFPATHRYKETWTA